MCGIVGGVAERNVTPILLEGLRRLEYRGYDSSGIALLDSSGSLQRCRSIGKIKLLEAKITEQFSQEKNQENSFSGHVGIAHTRWATHGVPAENNAHPHISNDNVAVVHNGIIENYQILKADQLDKGYQFSSETDTEVIAHAIDDALKTHKSLLSAVQSSLKKLKGAFALGVVSPQFPGELVAAREGSPLVIGVGIGEYFIASDVSALLPVTQEFIFLEEGDVAHLTRNTLQIIDINGKEVVRETKTSSLTASAVELGEYRHYMHKEIFEQPQAVRNILEGRVSQTSVLNSAFGTEAEAVFETIERVRIVSCGTSYHSALTAGYWFEDMLGLPTRVEVASEFRYRNPVLQNNTLFVTISQSGETADTLAALRMVKEQTSNLKLNYPTLSICNAAESSLTRESDLVFLTHAGPEIGVASTKAFTTQLVALALLGTVLGKIRGQVSKDQEAKIAHGLQLLPSLIQDALKHEDDIKEVAQEFADKENTIFLGRGTMYPIALEAALKLKEVTYIHAEAYPAGELKHGPLALIDEHTPIIAIAPANDLLNKLKSNIQEVKARGGRMIILEDESSPLETEDNIKVLKITTNVGRITSPILFNIPLQLLAYHVALTKGTDVDQPRNLAKSVTVE